eukprot:TRINITY_DN4211_c0_g2_i1.p1 TRINITY_DN4211_c0_g2~~TRINITY_DN4211_c0_g2_i1.p1  ORF type:complete len:340 (-),score=51.69 TRINITY_DN4211_c0_g2_i1:39-1058(-)
MYKYCEEKGIKTDRCGKVIVAVKDEELPRIEALYKRGIENGVKGLKMLDAQELKEKEPHCFGIKAIHVPGTGIVDFSQVVESYANDAKKMGAEVKLSFEAEHFTPHVVNGHRGMKVTSKGGSSVTFRYLITTAGCWSDRLAVKTGGSPEPAIVPFRGDFLKLKPQFNNLVKGMIYPIPNPAFPFLGVHFTRRINGEVWLGPNAVLATSRSGYSFKDFDLKDMCDAAMHPGLRSLVTKHFFFGLGELYRDIFPSAYLEHLKPYMPHLTIDQITEGPSGVRAQAISPDGKLVEDFVFDTPAGSNTLHVRNASSPAATSSLVIGRKIVDTAGLVFNVKKQKK